METWTWRHAPLAVPARLTQAGIKAHRREVRLAQQAALESARQARKDDLEELRMAVEERVLATGEVGSGHELTMHVCVCMFACACLRVHVCVCMFACACLRAHVCVRMFACACLRVHVCVRMFACACLRAHVCVRMFACACLRAHVCVRMFAYACACMYVDLHFNCTSTELNRLLLMDSTSLISRRGQQCATL